MKGQIVVVGSLNMDLVIRTPRMPSPGETLTGYGFQTIPGGKGANQAVAAARQGANVTMIGRVGDDDFGRTQQRCLGEEHIDLSVLTVDPRHATGVAVITLDEAGENSIIISPEANGAVSVEQIDAARDVIARVDMLLCQLETPLEAVTRAIEVAHENGVPVVLNPAPARQLEQSLLEKVTYLIPNETEASLLTGDEVTDIESAQEAAIQLQKRGVQTVILTLGENGAVVAHEGTCVHETAVPMKVVDTTAAGDTFVGSFAVALTEGKTVIEAVRFAKHAAALAVTKLGAQPSIPTRQEAEQFIAKSN
jgi:ribokinase